jgi:hypothetical protein
MKNILAENMLRFGPKNLSESEKRNLSKLVDQGQPGVENNSNVEQLIVSKLGDRSKRLWGEMDPADKQKLLDASLQQINRYARINDIDFDKSIKKLKTVRIGTKPGETKLEKIPPQSAPIIEIPYTATYPDNTKQNPELQNFYLTDNETAVSSDRQSKFEIMVSELKSLIPNNETIKEIHIKAGSSTSQVPTTYRSGTYKTIEEGQRNNIALSQDRCAQIEAVLNKIVKQQFPQYVGQIIVDDRDMKPNNGPSYTATERSYFFGTGKLDPAKKSEYEAKYGLYKGSYGSVMVVTEGKSGISTETGDEIKVPATEYYIDLGWGGTSDKGKRKLYKSKTGGGISLGGAKIIPNCPIW